MLYALKLHFKVKTFSITTLAYHLLITSQARDLAKFITPDLELNVAPCVITCFRKILLNVQDV